MTITREDIERTARAAYTPTADDEHRLRDALKVAILGSLLATYRQAASALGVSGAAQRSPTKDVEALIETQASEAASGIVATFAANIASHVSSYLDAAAETVAEMRDAISGLVSSTRAWVRDHLGWKAPQITGATTGAGIDDGSEAFADDYLDGVLEVGDDIDPQNVEVAVVPEEASGDICSVYAGNTYPIEDYQLIPDFPVHPNCPHLKIVQYIDDEAAA